jgi:signal peptidase II
LTCKVHLFLFTSLPCLLIDQVSKGMAESHLRFVESLAYFNGRVHFGYTENRAAFWGLGSSLDEGSRFLLLSCMATLAIVALAYVMWTEERSRPLQMVAYSLLITGGLCNVLDRLSAGYVVDFMSLELGVLRTGVFNLADAVIAFGVVLIFWTEVRRLSSYVQQ